MKLSELDSHERLRRAVHRAANDLLSRGVRPTVAHIESSVEGTRHLLTTLLRDWAGQLMETHQVIGNLTDRFPAENDSTGVNHGDARVCGIDRVHDRAEATLRKQQARQLELRRELEFEINRAREKLLRLEARAKNHVLNEVQAQTMEKAKLRLAALQAKLDESTAAQASLPARGT